MGDVKHTPGPWLIEGNTVYALSKHDINIFDAEVHAGYGDDDHKLSSDILQANAHLIAAAPDLLASLEEIIKCLDEAYGFDKFPDPTSISGRARAAAAKARGETP